MRSPAQRAPVHPLAQATAMRGRRFRRSSAPLWTGCFVEGFGGTVRDGSNRSNWPDADTAAAVPNRGRRRERPDGREVARSPLSRAGSHRVRLERDKAVEPRFDARARESISPEPRQIILRKV
jgi:hypothetical protein